jgi:hypothetical protein
VTRAPDVPLRALLEVARALVRRSGTGRVLLARAAGCVAPGALPTWGREPAEALDRARAELSEPLARKAVERALRDAWGKPPARVLDELELDPAAAVTPLAQVHRGALDGTAVAVKVARPGLDASIRADLALLDGLRAPLAAALPGLDAGGTLREIRERVLDELDLEHGAAQQRAVARALRGTADVEVPAVHSELAAPGVLVDDWLAGPTLAEQQPHDPAAVARALVAAHADAARAGLVLTDARPNHVVLRPGGGIGLLGTGAAVTGDRARVARWLALVAALRQSEPAGFAAASRALELWVDDADAVAAHALLREIFGALVAGGPARLDGPALAAAAERGLQRRDAALALAARARPAPGDVWLARGFAQLVAVLAGLGATEDWPALLK